MAKLLIVDDQRAYCEGLAAFLRQGGHEAVAACSGRQAIAAGARWRPDLLVVDWLLGENIHGLHVAAVLRAVDPDVRVVLMTGFGSEDVRADAGRAGVEAFLEKPFEVELLQAKVAEALACSRERKPAVVLGVLELDQTGRIVYANPRARELLARAGAEQPPERLDSLFPPGEAPLLDQAIGRWLAASPLGGERVHWHFRSQPVNEAGSRMAVLLLPEDPHRSCAHLIDMLLDVRGCGTRPAWPYEGHVLVVEHDGMARRFAQGMLEAAGACCYVAQTGTEALRLFDQDEDIRYVVLDQELRDTDPGELGAEFRRRRPDLTIIPCCSDTPSKEDAAEHQLTKPWRVRDLVGLIDGGEAV